MEPRQCCFFLVNKKSLQFTNMPCRTSMDEYCNISDMLQRFNTKFILFVLVDKIRFDNLDNVTLKLHFFGKEYGVLFE